MNYKDIYNEKKHTAEQVASMIQDDWVCCTDLAAAMPVELLDALGKRSASGLVRNLRLNCSLDIEPMYALHEDAYPGITPVSWFSGNKMAKAVNAGRGDYMPCYYRDMPMLHRAFAPSDAFFARVCPMDEEGNMYVGLDGSYTYQQFEDAKHIFLEVNEHMPRAINGPKINISRVDALYESSRELPVFPPAELDEISKQIAGCIIHFETASLNQRSHSTG